MLCWCFCEVLVIGRVKIMVANCWYDKSIRETACYKLTKFLNSIQHIFRGYIMKVMAHRISRPNYHVYLTAKIFLQPVHLFFSWSKRQITCKLSPLSCPVWILFRQTLAHLTACFFIAISICPFYVPEIYMPISNLQYVVGVNFVFLLIINFNVQIV